MSVSVVYMKDFTKGIRGIKYSGPRKRIGEIVVLANATSVSCRIEFVSPREQPGVTVKPQHAVLLSSKGLPPAIKLRFDPSKGAIVEPIPFPPGPGRPKPPR